MFKRKSKSDNPAKAAKPAKAKKEKPVKAKKEKPAKVKKAAVPVGPVKKQPTDIYTVMLMIAMGAVLVGCILLFLELSRFGSYPWWKATL